MQVEDNRIRLSKIESDVSEIRKDVTGIKRDITEIKTQQVETNKSLNNLEAGQKTILSEIRKLSDNQSRAGRAIVGRRTTRSR